MKWKTLTVGNKVTWIVRDSFDNRIKPCGIEAVVTEIHNDHVIAKSEDLTLWIDDDNCEDFREV